MNIESTTIDMGREETDSWGAGEINSGHSGKWGSEEGLRRFLKEVGLAVILERWKDLGVWKEIQAAKAGGRTVQWQKGTACHHAVCHFAAEAKKKLGDEVRKVIPG